MTITIDGMTGGIGAPNVQAGAEVALQLLLAGYSVHVNGLRVVVFYGPGYDYAMWDEGDFKGQPLYQS